MNPLFLEKVCRILSVKADAFLGRFYSLEKTLKQLAARPFQLHLELTNVCNAKCIFCPYAVQSRPPQFMSDEVFYKAVSDYCQIGGGSVGLTPIVGDPLIDPKFLERVKYLRAQPQIDRIFAITNAILLDKFGVEEIVKSGINAISISTAGFDEVSYERVYRNKCYARMKKNVFDLLEANAAQGSPVHLTIAFRTDRTLKAVTQDPDFKAMLKFNPITDYTWSFTTAGGRIKKEMLSGTMKPRKVGAKKEPCFFTYDGPMVLAGGEVMICSCVAAMDADKELGIGNILNESLLAIWTGERASQVRASFGTKTLNAVCQNCDMYRDLEWYRTREGREKAEINRLRHEGKIVRRPYTKRAPLMGG